MSAVETLLSLVERMESAEFFAKHFKERMDKAEARVMELDAQAAPARMCSEVDETLAEPHHHWRVSHHGGTCAIWRNAPCDCAVSLNADIRACFRDDFHPELKLAGKILAAVQEGKEEARVEERERIIDLLTKTLSRGGAPLIVCKYPPDGGSVSPDGLRSALEPKP